MPSVKVSEQEPFDVALRRFKRVCEKTGVLGDLRRKERYIKPTKQRQFDKKAAIKRDEKRLAKQNASEHGSTYTKRLKTVVKHVLA